MNVKVSVENECKFCGWKAEKGQNPIFVKQGTTVFAFCPMCNYELNISWQKEENDMT